MECVGPLKDSKKENDGYQRYEHNGDIGVAPVEDCRDDVRKCVECKMVMVTVTEGS